MQFLIDRKRGNFQNGAKPFYKTTTDKLWTEKSYVEEEI